MNTFHYVYYFILGFDRYGFFRAETDFSYRYANTDFLEPIFVADTALEIQISRKSTLTNLLSESLWERAIYLLPDSPGPEHEPIKSMYQL